MTETHSELDKLKISELLSRAAYALDERDVDMLSACFSKVSK